MDEALAAILVDALAFHCVSWFRISPNCQTIQRGANGGMIVRKAFRYRLYPNRAQEGSLDVQGRHNWGLSKSQERYPGYC